MLKRYYCRIGRNGSISCRSMSWNQCKSCRQYQEGRYHHNFPVPSVYAGVIIMPDIVVILSADDNHAYRDVVIVKEDFPMFPGWTYV